MSKPVIVVFGATGRTGGGMVEAILNDGAFQARAVTRNTDSEAAKGASISTSLCNELLTFLYSTRSKGRRRCAG